MKEYKMYHDPRHGWLAVPSIDLIEAGVERVITGFSFMSPMGEVVYLEEDCDAGTFLRAIEAKGVAYAIRHIRSNRSAPCTRYQSYYWE